MRLNRIRNELDFLNTNAQKWESDSESYATDEDLEGKKEFEVLHRDKLERNVRVRDEYDVEYDVGKVKKVRRKEEKVKVNFAKTAKH